MEVLQLLPRPLPLSIPIRCLRGLGVLRHHNRLRHHRNQLSYPSHQRLWFNPRSLHLRLQMRPNLLFYYHYYGYRNRLSLGYTFQRRCSLR